MDVTATFLGLCKAKRALDASVAKALQKNRPEPFSTTKVVKRPQSDFQRHASECVALVTQARNEILRHKKDYLDPHSGLSDSQRTDLETEILLKLNACNDSIKKLKQDVHHDRSLIKTHRTEVVRILDVYLASVSRLLTEQQAIRVKRALEQAKMSKLKTFGSKVKKPAAKTALPETSSPPKTKTAVHQNKTAAEDDVPVHRPADTFSSEELTMFESENANLYDELSGMEDEVRIIENQMTEISQLQQVFTENVLIQEHQIENVAAAAVGATENIKSGNIDIREAIQKTASFRAWILFVVLVLSFTLLFLDWYNE